MGDDGVHFGPVGGVEGDEAVVGGLAFVPGRVGGIVPELVVLDHHPHHVDAEAVDAAVEPEAEDFEDCGLDLGVSPVEVGLGGEEGVIEVLASVLVPGPGGAAEVGEPVVGGAALGGGVVPEIPVIVGVVGVGGVAVAAGLEPGVLIGGVVGDEIEDDAEVEGVGLVDEGVEVIEGAEEGIDVAVVGDVVAEVGHGGWVDGGDPDGVDPEFCEVGEAGGDAFEVSCAVVVAVLEGARIDLVDDSRLPPEVFHSLVFRSCGDITRRGGHCSSASLELGG